MRIFNCDMDYCEKNARTINNLLLEKKIFYTEDPGWFSTDFDMMKFPGATNFSQRVLKSARMLKSNKIKLVRKRSEKWLRTLLNIEFENFQ